MSKQGLKGSVKKIITKDTEDEVRSIFEQSLIKVWKTSRPMTPRMRFHFKISFIESYYSTVGEIFFQTPYFRGREFSDVIMFHEAYHWVIYPVDLFRGIREVFEARRMLAEELHFKPKIKKETLWYKIEDWSGFEYTVKEIQFVQNILGDYLVNLHIRDMHPSLWGTLWLFLYNDGTFYEKEKAAKRDTTFMLYLSVYPILDPTLPEVPLKDEKSKEKAVKIAELVTLCREGKISTVLALKEMCKLFHENILQDIEEMKKKQQEGEGSPKCPRCGNDEWEIVAYEDPKTGKWVKVK